MTHRHNASRYVHLGIAGPYPRKPRYPRHPRHIVARVACVSRRNEDRMALSDIEAKLDPKVPWRTCAVCHYLSEQDDEWGERLRRMLGNRGIKFKDLARSLANDPDEPTIPWEALSRHAQAGCSARERLR